MFLSGAEEMGQKLGRPNYKSISNSTACPGSVLAGIKVLKTLSEYSSAWSEFFIQ